MAGGGGVHNFSAFISLLARGDDTQKADEKKDAVHIAGFICFLPTDLSIFRPRIYPWESKIVGIHAPAPVSTVHQQQDGKDIAEFCGYPREIGLIQEQNGSKSKVNECHDAAQNEHGRSGKAGAVFAVAIGNGHCGKIGWM